MTHNYQFNTADWQNDFDYAVAPHTKAKAKFTVENGDLKNEYNDQIGEHDYVSVISKKSYGIGAEIKAKCSFSGTGAPCFVFTNDLSTDGEYLKYGLHFEVCVYVGGVNVWRIEPWPERVERPIKTAKLHAAAWEPSTTELECTVKFGDKKITVCVEDKEFCVECEDFPTEMHLGFTACEGPCTIHSYEITEAAE